MVNWRGALGHRISWSHDQLVTWSVGLIISWSLDQLVTWSVGHMISWSHDQLFTWSVGHMISWSHDQLVTWSVGHMLSWSHDQLVTWYLHLDQQEENLTRNTNSTLYMQQLYHLLIATISSLVFPAIPLVMVWRQNKSNELRFKDCGLNSPNTY